MKKLCSLLISICLCAVIFCHAPLTLTAETNTAKATVIDLVRLKKHLAGMRSVIGDADYNNDGTIDSRDMASLKRILLGLPAETESSSKPSVYDKEGYYNQVIKP